MIPFLDKPGYLFVVATLLPLASFVLLLLLSGVWCLARRYDWESVEKALGSEDASKGAAYLAMAAIGLAFVCSLAGGIQYFSEQHETKASAAFAQKQATELRAEEKKIASDLAHKKEELAKEQDEKRKKALTSEIGSLEQNRDVKKAEITVEEQVGAGLEKDFRERWNGSLYQVLTLHASSNDPDRSSSLEIGFKIDALSALMFVMVTFIATLIHLFSSGYMAEELPPENAEDHHVHTAEGHLHRRGRFARFFMYLSLFCFSMLNLVLANNLFQVFVSWELVGVCSFLLIGFYFERRSASNAANKAFITNRIGDAGFILGLLIIWGYLGTFDFDKMFAQVRHRADADSHQHKSAFAGKIVSAKIDGEVTNGEADLVPVEAGKRGSHAILFPSQYGDHWHSLQPDVAQFANEGDRRPSEYGYMPYWMLVAAGLGIFLGCVGKSAQFPLQVWLPDAMEGPTPVSALIHAATMVAAGVYLVGRCFPLFTPEVLITIAYIGGITLFVAATIAMIATDIKKVLAYSTVSQLGYMMLALGVGGWVAGLFHLITHAVFKALLFLCSGSVIYGCHHEQEMTKMGGLFNKMRITAITMLMGVLAIAGIPLFSGWYSKDAIIAQAFGFASVHPEHILLFLLPLVTAGITTFYMFRMWFMTFTGPPRDEHVHETAHESPWQMTTPLIVLGILSVVVAWSHTPWDATSSYLDHALRTAEPASVQADFGHGHGHGHASHGEHGEHAADPEHAEHAEGEADHPAATRLSLVNPKAHELHELGGFLALAVVGIGLTFALMTYYYRALDPNEAVEQFPGVYNFLVHKWYFDEAYETLLVKPVMIVARGLRDFDLYVLDGAIHSVARGALAVAYAHGEFDRWFIDGLVNLLAQVTRSVGYSFRAVQTGYLRSYVMFLALGAVALFVLFWYLVAGAYAG